MAGSAGKVTGQTHKVFKDFLAYLKEFSARAYDAETGAGQRQWFTPPGFVGDLLDIAGLHQPSLDRDAINTNYEQAIQSILESGTTADLAALKLQIDYLAAAERAWRVRHSTAVRSLAHTAGRRYGQGNGAIFDRIREQVDNLLKAGGASQK